MTPGPEAALRRAFNISPICNISRYFADLRQDHAPKTAGAPLTAWERVADAAMLQAFVRRLPDEQAAHIMAQFGPRASRPGAYKVLTEYVMKVGHELTNAHLVRELVARCYGKRVEKLHQKLRVDRKTVYLQGLKVRKILHGVGDEAEAAVVEHLGLGE